MEGLIAVSWYKLLFINNGHAYIIIHCKCISSYLSLHNLVCSGSFNIPDYFGPPAAI